METATINLSWLYMSIPIGIVVMIAILGTQSRLKYVTRLQEAYSRGAFAEMTPEAKSRLRRLGLQALVCMLDMILCLGLLVIQMANGFTSFSGISALGVLMFGILALLAGFRMKREVDRRL